MNELNKNIELFRESLITSITNYRLAFLLSKEKLGNINKQTLDFIVFHEHLYFKNFIIEISKLVGDTNNDKISAYKLLNIFIENKNNNLIDKKKTLQKAEMFRDQLNHESEIINKIKKIRDKLYSHTDLEFDNSLLENIDFDTFEKLLRKLQFIFDFILMVQFNKSHTPLIEYSYGMERELKKILTYLKN